MSLTCCSWLADNGNGCREGAAAADREGVEVGAVEAPVESAIVAITTVPYSGCTL